MEVHDRLFLEDPEGQGLAEAINAQLPSQVSTAAPSTRLYQEEFIRTELFTGEDRFLLTMQGNIRLEHHLKIQIHVLSFLHSAKLYLSAGQSTQHTEGQ